MVQGGESAAVAEAPDSAAVPASVSPSVFSAIPPLFAFAVLATQGYLAIGRNFANLLETPFLPYCLLGTFCIHMATRPGLKERLWTVTLGAPIDRLLRGVER